MAKTVWVDDEGGRWIPAEKYRDLELRLKATQTRLRWAMKYVKKTAETWCSTDKKREKMAKEARDFLAGEYKSKDGPQRPS